MSETCTCSEFIPVASSSQELKPRNSNSVSVAAGLKKVISELLIDTCGYCEEYGKTNLVYTNDSNSKELVFPVTKTSYSQSSYSKFIPVVRVPGVVVITRKKQLSTILTKATSGSILKSWPISVITIMMAMLAGIIVWFLVRITVCCCFICFLIELGDETTWESKDTCRHRGHRCEEVEAARSKLPRGMGSCFLKRN